MYLLLHRAKRNAGDYLIFERAKRLIRTLRPERKHLVGKAWIPLESQFSIDTIKSDVKAIIICGGPGYSSDIYPNVYPLVSDLGRLPAPVILLALGSFVFPGTAEDIRSFKFTPESRKFLSYIAEYSPYMGARDQYSLELLSYQGFSNVLMTGDPAWYDLDRLHQDPPPPRDRINRILFTPPTRPIYFQQGLDVLRGLSERYVPSNISVVFHRGLQDFFVQEAAHLGYETLNIEGSAKGFNVYDSADLHVGYRVHAHLYCLSRGIISYLIAEDSRGVGVHSTLGQLGCSGFDASSGLRLKSRFISFTHRVRGSWGVQLSGVLLKSQVPSAILAMIERDLVTGYNSHAVARVQIRRHYPSMVKMIQSLP